MNTNEIMRNIVTDVIDLEILSEATYYDINTTMEDEGLPMVSRLRADMLRRSARKLFVRNKRYQERLAQHQVMEGIV